MHVDVAPTHFKAWVSPSLFQTDQMAQYLNVALLNALYKSLIPKIANLDVIVSIDKFLVASEQVAASRVGRFSFQSVTIVHLPSTMKH